MLTAVWSMKGGVGVSTVAAMLAIAQSERAHASVLVDLVGDVPALLGLPEAESLGVTDWCATPDASSDALARIEQQARVDLTPAVAAIEHDHGDGQVQQHVAGYDDHVPGEHRARQVRGTYEGKHVEHALGVTEVDDDEQTAHDDRGHGQELTQDGYPSKGLVVVDIVGQYDHDARGRYADEIGKLSDVESPGYIPAHAGDAQSLKPLIEIITETDPYQCEQEDDLTPVCLTPL